jgi:hypothetical protein
MHHYDCQSRLTVTCHNVVGEESTNRVVTIILAHHESHVPYYDVEMPQGASDIIRESLEWTTPVTLVPKIQALYPNVSANQIHAAWSQMSETLWKKDEQQLPSVEKLLAEYPDDVDVFQVPKVDGVEQLCWGMKRISGQLKGKVVEIGHDATCAYLCADGRNLVLTSIPDNTNSKHLELYSILGEHDNAGFPLSYCLLSTATAIDIGKHTKALTAWTNCLRDTYSVTPVFAHVDKDMAEIGML